MCYECCYASINFAVQRASGGDHGAALTSARLRRQRHARLMSPPAGPRRVEMPNASVVTAHGSVNVAAISDVVVAARRAGAYTSVAAVRPRRARFTTSGVLTTLRAYAR